MKDLIINNISDIKAIAVNFGGRMDFTAKPVIPWEDVQGCSAAFIEIPVGNCSYPYHWHGIAEEIFYIISGQGKLRTFHGEKDIKAGDVICFPSGEKGIHAIENTSKTERLVYIDFAANPKTDITIEPDANQVKIYGEHISDMTLDMPKK